jgi:hypothetical protein
MGPAAGKTAQTFKPDEQYIVRLIGQVITLSPETMKMVKGLPPLEMGGADDQS